MEGDLHMSVPTSSQALQDLVEKYHQACLDHERAKEAKEVLGEQLVSYFPDAPGEYEAATPKMVCRVVIPEKFDWDQDLLGAMFAGAKLPDYVSQRLSISRKKFEALTEAEQNAVKVALTRGPGSPRITIKSREDK
jgi:hypothetical protein